MPDSHAPSPSTGEARPLHLERANPTWKLIMQSGVDLVCTVGLPLNDFMRRELDLTPDQQCLAEALVLDGMPVDDPNTAIVPDGARLALAAGLPGIAGLAMKKDSGVKVLRATITHLKQEEADPRPGHITLCLYSLVLPVLAGHFLRRGVVIRRAQLERYARFSPDDVCRLGPRTLTVGNLVQELAADPASPETFLLTADIDESRSGLPQ